MDLDELAKSTRVVVAHRLGVAERFQQRVGCNKNHVPHLTFQTISLIRYTRKNHVVKSQCQPVFLRLADRTFCIEITTKQTR